MVVDENQKVFHKWRNPVNGIWSNWIDIQEAMELPHREFKRISCADLGRSCRFMGIDVGGHVFQARGSERTWSRLENVWRGLMNLTSNEKKFIDISVGISANSMHACVLDGTGRMWHTGPPYSGWGDVCLAMPNLETIYFKTLAIGPNNGNTLGVCGLDTDGRFYYGTRRPRRWDRFQRIKASSDSSLLDIDHYETIYCVRAPTAEFQVLLKYRNDVNTNWRNKILILHKYPDSGFTSQGMSDGTLWGTGQPLGDLEREQIKCGAELALCLKPPSVPGPYMVWDAYCLSNGCQWQHIHDELNTNGTVNMDVILGQLPT